MTYHSAISVLGKWFLCLSLRSFIIETYNSYLWYLKTVNWGISPNPGLYFLSCFVESFYFIRLEVIVTSSRQECLCKGALIAVPTWCGVGVTKVCVWICIWWSVVIYTKVPSSPENRSIRGATVCGISPVRTILSCLSQFHRRPSWLVYQRKQESFRSISITTTGN